MLDFFHIILGMPSWYKPLLEDKRRFPDSSFSASASSEGHSASDARISRGRSWCAPVSDEKNYLQVNLGRLYRLYYIVTYGDSTSPKWVATYNLNDTTDFVNWNTRVRKNDVTNKDVCSVLTYYTHLVTFHCSRCVLLFLYVETSRKQKSLQSCSCDIPLH
jgi:hypothetical protein